MPHELPTGTVTFLFTDVEGSTRLLQELGVERYGDALADHRRVLRGAFAEHAGVEIDTQGDAFFVAFPTAPGALAAAAAVRDGLAPGPISVRIGIHTGTPHLTGEGYVGVDVHRAARIAACGHGGQVLVSASTAAIAGLDGMRDLGEFRLKDLVAAERIYQLGDGVFPPLKAQRQTNLPIPSTAFLGRERELGEVVETLERPDVRLLTLTGPGGTGKTRLALQAAADLAPAYPHGVWWVSLAPLRDPELVLEATAQALGAKDDLAGEIGDRSMLILLDNFEHVVDAAGGLADLLGACQALDLLVTSREPLHLTAEHEYEVPPLAREESIRFFVERARVHRPGFEADVAVVPEICRRLDDLPLALELTAARVKVLSSGQILERLDRRLPLLTGGPRDLPERQRTLRATIEWSYELLGPEERLVFARLAVFRGGGTLEAAEAVVDADLDLLQSLAEKSLLRHTDGRYWMLETVREYALERLGEAPDEALLRDRHARFFLDFAEAAEPKLVGAEQSEWLDRVTSDHENIRAALERFLAAGAVESALRLAGALVVFWFVRGHYGEGRAWLDRALENASPGESAPLAKALWGAGFLGVLTGDYEPLPALLERGLAVARHVGDVSVAARCLEVLGLLAFFQDHAVEARSLFEESIAEAREAGDLWCLADALGTLGSICPLQGDFDAADALGREGLAVARQSGDQQGVRMSLFALALAAVRRGEPETAAEIAGEGLEVSRGIGDPWFVSYFDWLLACAALDRNDPGAARPAAEEALEVGLQAGGSLLIVCAREALARIEWAQGDPAGPAASSRRHSQPRPRAVCRRPTSPRWSVRSVC